MTMPESWQDDATLLAALADAVADEEPVPPDVYRSATAAYTWRTIDAELAALTHDSREETDRLVGVRSTATDHTLAFQLRDLHLEVDVTADRILGQVVAPGPATVTLQAEAGTLRTVGTGDSGFFSMERPAPGSIRLRVDVAGAPSFVTPWFRV